jgi:hypothetical protein
MALAALWTAAFLVAIFAPVVVRLFASERQSMGTGDVTGLLATSLLVCTPVLPSRERLVDDGEEAGALRRSGAPVADLVGPMPYTVLPQATDQMAPRGLGYYLKA